MIINKIDTLSVMKNVFLATVLIVFCLQSMIAQREARQRIPLIGSKAPHFKAPSTNGIISFPEDYGKGWKVLFAHPRDFTPVCSSEILELAYHQDDFTKLGAHILVISIDKMASHKSWKADLEKINHKGRGTVKINFPLVVDSTSSISYTYGMVDFLATNKHNVRGVFFIDPENTIRAFLFYPNEVGRNIDELIRLLKALQTQSKNTNTVMPANWQPGEDAMIPILTKEDKEEMNKPQSNIHFTNWYMIYRKLD